MKKKILSILLVLLIPVLFFAGCDKEPENKLNMARYFTSCSYTLKGSSSSVAGSVNSHLGSKHIAMKTYDTITIKGDSNWLYGMTLDYMTFEIYSASSGEFEIEVKITNMTKGTNELEQDPEKVLIQTFSGNVKAKNSKLIKIDINDIVKSVTAETNITFTFAVTPETTYTIESLKLYGSHK